MATYINPDAVKDNSLSKSKLDIALTNEINGKKSLRISKRNGKKNIKLKNLILNNMKKYYGKN